jgi:HEAT repeat protein
LLPKTNGDACLLNVLNEQKCWKGKPKELVIFLADKVKTEPALFPQLIEILKTGSVPQRGTIADVIEELSKVVPEIPAPYIDDITEFINYKAPRVKWGVSESIGNLSKKYPKETAKAIPKLLANTNDAGTVVRWSAAFALSEIAKNNPAIRGELLPKMDALASAEQNNGVKNVYLKALKAIKKEVK